jgi:predicted cupin superfamily sugar epimerase
VNDPLEPRDTPTRAKGRQARTLLLVNPEARAVIERLSLVPHPEGGFFRETFRAPRVVPTGAGERAASTAIYFLLPAGTFSALHRVQSDEIWHHYDGDPVAIHLLRDASAPHAPAQHTVLMLGRDFARGQLPQIVVPAGVWQAAVPIGDRYALCGCTVAPGFDFADFEMPPRAELVARMPAWREVIEPLSRP